MNIKSLVSAVALASALAAPAVSFAQSNEPVTRAGHPRENPLGS